MVSVSCMKCLRGIGLRVSWFGDGRGWGEGGFLGNLASYDNELSNPWGSFIPTNLMKRKKDPSLFFLSGIKTSTTLPRGLNVFHRSPFLMPTGMFDTYKDVLSGYLLCCFWVLLRRTSYQSSSVPP
ncbi:hypothetical protein LXL04_022323 [Taraxacum kok-saghyz]